MVKLNKNKVLQTVLCNLFNLLFYNQHQKLKMGQKKILIVFDKDFKYPGWDLNPHATSAHGPQPCLSTNFSTRVEKKPYENRAFVFEKSVTWLGFEPRTLTLKV